MVPFRLTALCLPCLLVPGVVQAEVTADQVWALMQEAVAESGARVSAGESRRGDRLVLTRPTIDIGDGALILLPDITLRETADRSVIVELPPRFPLTLDLPPGPNDPDRLTLTVAAPDLAITVHSLGDKADATVTAGSISASLDPFVLPPGARGPADIFVALAVADLALSWRHDLAGPALAADGSGSLGTLHADMRIDIPAEDIKGSMALDLSSIAVSLTGFAPPGTEVVMDRIDRSEGGLADFLGLLDNGLLLDASGTHGPLAFTFDAPRSPDGPVAMDLSTTNGGTSLVFDRKGIFYDSFIGPTRIFFRGRSPDFPLGEFDASLTEYRNAYSLGFPGAAGAAAANGLNAPKGGDAPVWGAVFKLTGLTLSQELWTLADPGKVMPRDPMSLVIDLAGTYTLDPKALEPGFKMNPDDPPPFTEASLDLAELLVSGLGLTMTGSGGLSFDFTDLVTYPDVPRPEGKMSFVTTGANALIDRFEQLGLMSEDDLTAARFGLLFMGRIEGGADRLVTEIEFKDRSFVLNGQRIR